MSAIFTRTARGAHGYCLIDIGYEARLTPPPEDYRNNNNNISFMCVHGDCRIKNHNSYIKNNQDLIHYMCDILYELSD